MIVSSIALNVKGDIKLYYSQMMLATHSMCTYHSKTTTMQSYKEYYTIAKYEPIQVVDLNIVIVKICLLEFINSKLKYLVLPSPHIYSIISFDMCRSSHTSYRNIIKQLDEGFFPKKEATIKKIP